MSGVRSQESRVRSQESGVKSQESGVKSQESGVRRKYNRRTTYSSSRRNRVYVIMVVLVECYERSVVVMVYVNKERTVTLVQMTVHPIWVPMLRQKIGFVAREVASKWFARVKILLVVTMISVIAVIIMLPWKRSFITNAESAFKCSSSLICSILSLDHSKTSSNQDLCKSSQNRQRATPSTNNSIDLRIRIH